MSEEQTITYEQKYTAGKILELEEIDNKLTAIFLKAKRQDKWLPEMYLDKVRAKIQKLEKKKQFLKKRKHYLKAISTKIKPSTAGSSPLPPPQAEAEDIRNNIKIRNILEQAGIEIHRNNKFLAVWRNDNNPSCDFNEKKNVFIDRATNEGGSVIDLYAKINNISIGEAMKELSFYL